MTMRLYFCLLLLLLAGCLVSCSSKPDPRMMRLKQLADTQQRSNDRALREAGGTVKGIQASVERNRNTAQDMVVLAQARAILERTEAVSERLRRMRAAVLDRLGGEYHPREMGSRQAVADTLLLPNSPVSADSLYVHLRAFTAYMQPLAPQVEQMPWLLPEDATHPTTASRTPGSAADYRRFYFEDASAAEVLAVLAQQEAEVLRLGLEGLAGQAQRVGSSDHYNLFRVGAYAIPESNRVRAGEMYTADLLLASTNRSNYDVRMTANGDTIRVLPDGRGQVRFQVPALPPGQIRRQAFWDGTISLRFRGEDTTFRVRVPYTIVR